MTKPRGNAVQVTPARRTWNVPGAGTVNQWSIRVPPDCKDCIHVGSINGRDGYFCAYLLNTHKSRVKRKAYAGSKGGCAVKETGEKRDRRSLRPDVNLRRRELYDQGLSDGEIARETGCVSSTIALWRKREGLPSHYKRRPRQKETRP